MKNEHSMRTALLKKKLDKMENILNNVIGGIELCEYTYGFPIIYISKGFTILTGYSSKDIIYTKHEDIVLSEDLPNLYIGKKENYSIEYRIKRKDGKIIWVLDEGVVVISKNHKKIVQRILTNITRQKETEEKLRISERRYEIAMNFSNVTIFDYDIVTKRLIHHLSDSENYLFPQIIDNAVESFIDSGMIMKNSIDDFRKLYSKIENGEPYSKAIVYFLHPDKSIKSLELQLNTIYDENGKPKQAIGIKRDITEVLSLQREKQYSDTLTSNKQFTYEANISKDIVLNYDAKWAKKLNLYEIFKFSDLVCFLSSEAIAPENELMFSQILSKENIVSSYENSKKLISFEYLKNIDGSKYQWYQQEISIIKEQITDDIIIRCYIANINDKKEKEIRALAEQKHYEVMVSKSDLVYEVNITKNIFVAGQEIWQKIFDIPQTNDYSEILNKICSHELHQDDIEQFQYTYSCENVLKCYLEGEREIRLEYRRLNKLDEFIWVRCTMNVFEDPYLGDIKGFIYIEDINDEKNKELELIYKSQHDLLTGLYNKITVEEKIDEFLSLQENKIGKHSFFIIDLDYFKGINDNFGHAFGDNILSQISLKIGNLFRNNDILGRIGGDEFIILMKNTPNEKITINKAMEICNCVEETYYKDGIHHSISASIGIAFYPKHGVTYKELYYHSDNSLYDAKERGRNRFSVYNSEIKMNSVNIKGIYEKMLTGQNGSKDDISERIFKILYESSCKEFAINYALEIICKHYNFSRTYIFENSPDDLYLTNTFEWCNEDISPQINNMQKIFYSDLDDYQANFSDKGVFFLSNVKEASNSVKKIVGSQSIMSILQISILKDGKFNGFIGFDKCDNLNLLNENEFCDYYNIANILGTFILEMRNG